MHGRAIHEITPGIDDGPIVSQLTYSIYPETDEIRDVYTRTLAYAWTLFEQTIPMLDRIDAGTQNPALATTYTPLGRSRRLIGLDNSILSMHSAKVWVCVKACWLSSIANRATAIS
jgi:methionyl-tRNA formyltransferase